MSKKKATKKSVSKNVSDTVENNTGKSLSEEDIQKLAESVDPQMMQNEEHLRQLVKQIAGMADMPVSEPMIDEIIRAFNGGAISSENMELLMNMMEEK